MDNNQVDTTKLSMYQVDAFTNRVFGGNSAAVVPLEDWLATETMQAIALENNLSETAFFVPVEDGRFHIRWFTPEVEVDLCGHATLAAAHILFTELEPERTQVEFNSLSGPLAVKQTDNLLTLDFPNRMPEQNSDAELANKLEDALGCKVESVHLSRDTMVVVKDEQTVRAISPDFAKLDALNMFGFMVTAEGDQANIDFVSRFFAPSQGVNEDPVTGSAHCTLAPYWAQVLGKQQLTAQQVSQRVGDLQCEVSSERVYISGQCVTYLRGTIEI